MSWYWKNGDEFTTHKRNLKMTPKTPKMVLGKMRPHLWETLTVSQRHWLSPRDALVSLGECTLLFKGIMSFHLWCLYVFPETWKTLKDRPAIFLIWYISMSLASIKFFGNYHWLVGEKVFKQWTACKAMTHPIDAHWDSAVCRGKVCGKIKLAIVALGWW